MKLLRIDPLQARAELLPFLATHVNDRMADAGYTWQFERIPEPVIFICGMNERGIACTQSFLPHDLLRGGHVIKSVKSEHSFLVEAMRGTPTFTDAYALGLSICAESGSRTCWGFTPAVKVWKKRLGFDVFEEDMIEVHAPLGWPSLRSVRSLRSAWRAMQGVLEQLPYLRRRIAQMPNAEWSDRLASEAEWTKLIAGIGGPDCIQLRMSESFCKWRMEENPNIHYELMALRNSHGALLASAIIGIDRKHPSAVHLAEAAATDEATWAMLLCEVKRRFGGSGRVLRAFANRHDPIFKQLWGSLRQQFPARRETNRAMAFVLKSDLPNSAISNWHITALWTQGFHR